MMQRILVIGAGKIGSLIAFLLANSNDYYVYLADQSITNRPDLNQITEKTTNLEILQLDANNNAQLIDFLKKNPVTAVVSSLPYYCNIAIATIANDLQVNYFDLTEDTHTTQTIAALAQNASSVFAPQCGLAPGFISIVAHDLMKQFPKLDSVKMRVGALPVNISNGLQYALTWSTDGLINEYGNLCHAIENGEEVSLLPLTDLEEIKIDGLTYEAFNTSGGIGSLASSYFGKIKHISYKTIRYPGHCEKMQFLMNDLQLNQDRETLKRILEKAIPNTTQDVALVYVSVTGAINNLFVEKNYVKKFYPKKINGLHWSAIQLTTASSLCAVLDLVLNNPKKLRGFIRQEDFSLEDITNNRFGQYFA